MLIIGVLELAFGPVFRWFLRRRGRALRAGELWAIAAGANLARLNGSSLTTLHTGHLPLVSRRVLREWWGVSDLAGLRAAIERLAAGGHRTEFAVLHALLADGPSSARVRAALGGANDLLDRPVVDFIWRNHQRFKNGDLVAWDFCRLINVARYGFSAGYMGQDEAWEAILAAAGVLQREYGSWAELSANYLLGFSYWQDGTAPDQPLAEAAAWLENDPGSPWKTLRWAERIG